MSCCADVALFCVVLSPPPPSFSLHTHITFIWYSCSCFLYLCHLFGLIQTRDEDDDSYLETVLQNSATEERMRLNLCMSVKKTCFKERKMFLIN